MNRALSSQWRAGRRRGFTLVEIALCIGIIGFALVAIIGVLPAGLRVQQENREDTLINQDAQYLLEAIRSGATGPATRLLTNVVASVQFGTTNYVYGAGPDQFTTGAELVGLLSRPRAIQRVILRNISGTASDLGDSATARSFAFEYAVFLELVPAIRTVTVSEPSVWNPLTNRLVSVTNHHELHMDFRWPVLPNGATGSGRKVFRTAIAGDLVPATAGTIVAPVYYFTPQTFQR